MIWPLAWARKQVERRRARRRVAAQISWMTEYMKSHYGDAP